MVRMNWGLNRQYRGAMVGREHHLAHAVSFLSELQTDDSPGMICYWAPAGVGKTRLVREIINLMPDHEFLIIEADEASGTDPFSDFFSRYFGIDVMGSLEGRRKVFLSGWDALGMTLSLQDGNRNRVLHDTLLEAKPYIEYVTGLDPETDSIIHQLEPSQRSCKIRSAISGFFGALSILQPTVVVLENIQWFSPENLLVIKAMLESAAVSIGGIIATGRPDGKGSCPEFPECAGTFRKDVIFLEGLPRGSITSFVREQTGITPDPEFSDFLWDRGGGVPLFLEQTIDYLWEMDFLSRIGDHLKLSVPDSEIQGSVCDFFLGRISCMPESFAGMVAAASILGRAFHRDILTRLVQTNSLEEDLNSALKNRIFVMDGDLISFSHVLFREWAVNLNPYTELQRLHLSTARILEERPGTATSAFLLEEVADHYQLGGDESNAAEYLQKSAERYADIFENDSAIVLFIRLASMVPEPMRTRAELSLAEVYRNSGLLNQGIELLSSTLNRITEIPAVDEVQVAQVKLKLGSNLGSAGKSQQAEVLLLESLRVFVEHGDISNQAVAVRHLGMITSAAGRIDEAITLVERSIDLARESDDPSLLCASLYWAAITYRQTGQYDLMRKYTNEQVEIALASGLIKSIIAGYDNLMRLHIYNREYEKAEEIHGKLRSAAELTANWAALSTATSKLGIIHLRKGENSEAIKCFRSCVELSEKTGNIRAKCAALGNIAGAYIGMGEPDRALLFATELIDTSAKIGFPTGLMSGYARMGYIFSLKGDYQSALECIHTQIEHATALCDCRNLSDAWATIAGIQMLMGENVDALSSVNRALESSRKANDMLLRGSQLGLRGKLLFMCGQLENARRDLTETINMNRGRKGREKLVFTSRLYLEAASSGKSPGNDASVEEIRRMAADAPDDSSRAEALYIHWHLTGDPQTGEECRLLLENICRKSHEPVLRGWLESLPQGT